ncbi:MAG: hypothetical protein F6K55_11415 [Moorea sp. SIO4A3]|nr:hypothetical protein [Moorena sp. SIO4A3]
MPLASCLLPLASCLRDYVHNSNRNARIFVPYSLLPTPYSLLPTPLAIVIQITPIGLENH